MLAVLLFCNGFVMLQFVRPDASSALHLPLHIHETLRQRITLTHLIDGFIFDDLETVLESTLCDTAMPVLITSPQWARLVQTATPTPLTSLTRRRSLPPASPVQLPRDLTQQRSEIRPASVGSPVAYASTPTLAAAQAM